MYPLCRIETRLVTYRIDTLSECCSPPRLAIFELARSSRTNIIEILAVNILRWSNPRSKSRYVDIFSLTRREFLRSQGWEEWSAKYRNIVYFLVYWQISSSDEFDRSERKSWRKNKETKRREKKRDDHWLYVSKVTKASWNNTVVIIRMIYYSSNMLQ